MDRPTLIKMLHCHSQVIHWLEEAARNTEWTKLRGQLDDIGVASKMRFNGMYGAPLLFACMKADLRTKYPPVMMVMNSQDTNSPYAAYLSGHSDSSRVGHFSTSWVFSRAGTKQMIKDGFNVESLSEEVADRV